MRIANILLIASRFLIWKNKKKSIDITTVIRFKLYPGGYLTGNIAIRLIHPTDQTKENHGKKSYNRKYL